MSSIKINELRSTMDYLLCVLEAHGLAELSIKDYRSTFGAFERYVKERKVDMISESICLDFIESKNGIRPTDLYGAPKIAECLRREGEKTADKTVGNYMRELGIKAQYVKPYTVTTIRPDLSSRLRNILKEKFNPEEPDAVWCSDITYIWTYEGFVYLTSIMDLYLGKIISWVLSDTLEAKYVVKAVEKAKRRRGVEKPLILHTDRGIQYVCREYVEATAGMKRSYSKKAYPWDNACIESFHALIKREWLNRFKIKNYDHAYKLVFEYIETFYNTVRIHSHCGYLSPNEYENEYEQKLNKMEKLAG